MTAFVDCALAEPYLALGKSELIDAVKPDKWTRRSALHIYSCITSNIVIGLHNLDNFGKKCYRKGSISSIIN